MKLLRAVVLATMLLASLGETPVQAQTCGTTYTVQAGDTLYSIGAKCGISYVVLVNINFELNDPNNIHPGTVIRLVAETPLSQYTRPFSGPAQVAGYQPGGTYIVRKGDSLARIAYLYSTSVAELVRLNPPLTRQGVLFAGQVLQMPPDARHIKGWVGLSTLSAGVGDRVDVLVLDFPAYANIEFRVGMHGEDDDFDYQVVDGKTDSYGTARATITIPYYAWQGEEWEVRVVNLDASPETRVLSPIITITD